MCAEVDANTKSKLETSCPELAALVPDAPPRYLNQVPADVDASQIPALVQAQLLADGLIFEPSFVEAFLLALKTKPLVILSGISGTGKSALPRALARMVGNDVQPIAIAPDWTDNSDMLGYFDMNGQFISGEFTSLVAQAALAPDTPFFVVLDEMNLARVEYYFAQVLSVLESRRRDPQSGTVSSTDYLFNPAMRDRLASQNNAPAVRALAALRFGPNLYLIGTVNIDETTHPFSKKVLDRANVLEVNDVDLMQGLGAPTDDAPPAPADVPASNAFFAGNITRMSELGNQCRARHRGHADADDVGRNVGTVRRRVAAPQSALRLSRCATRSASTFTTPPVSTPPQPPMRRGGTASSIVSWCKKC